MPHIRLVCWDAEREGEHRGAIAKAGFEVDPEAVAPSKLVTHIRLTQPDVVAIDLDRLPSHGYEVAVVLRKTKSTRGIPLVFLGGDPVKTVRIRAELTDAIYGSWTQVAALIRKAAKQGRQAAPVVPLGPMERHAGSSLEKKLGLTPGEVAVIGAPETFGERIGIPTAPRVTPKTKLAIWFIRSRVELDREMAFMALHPPLWIAFPKQTGKFKSDFNQHNVRRAAALEELVDNKVCAIDEDWSAIRFARRK